MSSLRRIASIEPGPRKTQRKAFGTASRTPRGPRARWDRRYREEARKWRRPDPFLPRAYRLLAGRRRPPGRALDVAGGVGRHALWLARRGWQVTVADISPVGLEEAGRRARRAQVKLRLLACDLGRGRLPRGRYDLVLVFFFLERKLFPALARALRPGGILIYKTYTRAQLKPGTGGPKDPRQLLRPGELRQAFPGLRILSYREVVGEKAVAELVAGRIGRKRV